MINYVKIIKEIKKLNIEEEKKNRVIKNAIAEQVLNLPAKILKIPFKLILAISNLILSIFELLESGLDFILNIFCVPSMIAIDLIEKIPPIHCGDREEFKEICILLQESRAKKITEKDIK